MADIATSGSPIASDRPAAGPTGPARRSLGIDRSVWRKLRDEIATVLGLLRRRAAYNGGLAFATAVGIALAAAFLVSVPLYSEAVLTVQLRDELRTASRAAATIILRQTAPRSTGAVAEATFEQADAFVRTTARDLLGGHVRPGARLAQSEQVPILVGEQQAGGTRSDYSAYGFFLFVDELAEHVEVSEGRLPAGFGDSADVASSGEELEAIMMTAGIDELGVKVGDTLQALVPAVGGQRLIPIRIVGRWDPVDPESPFWIDRPDSYKLAIVVSERVYFDEVLAQYPRVSREFTWSLLLDPESLRAGDARVILGGIQALRAAAPQAARALRVDVAPDDILDRYERRSYFLSTLLLSLAAPIMVLVLQFTGLTSSLLVDRQRGEIAALRSRGATIRHIVGIYLIEGVVVALGVVILAPIVGSILAMLVGQSSGFLRLAPTAPLPVFPNAETVLYGALAAALGVGAAVAPAVAAARHSIVTYRREIARAARQSLWRRYGLDLLPLPVAGYGYFLLSQRQTVLSTGASGEVLSDPLLIIAPALFILALGLVVLRLLPPLLGFAQRIMQMRASPPLLLAVRQLARRPTATNGVVLLLMLTTALGIFSASMAATLDRGDVDTIAYRIGSDLRVTESGNYDEETGEWSLLPVGEHLQAPGVVGAARVHRGSAIESLGGRNRQIDLLSIDAFEMYGVVHWRDDYADVPLAELLGALTSDPSGIVLDRRLADQYRLNVGDQLTLTIRDQPIDFTVVGAAHLFPTVYPNERPFAIANLDYVFDRSGPQPFDVWMRIEPGVATESVVENLEALGFQITRSESYVDALGARQSDSTRLGVLGLLSGGFVIAAALSVTALVLSAYLSFRRRALQLGILRAIGFQQNDVITLFVAEQGVAIAAGVGAGTIIGLVTSRLFIPFLQVKLEQHAGTPPVLAVLPWLDFALLYAVLALLLAPAVPFAVRRLLHFRIHEAIKFGEEAV